ncbi:UDP-N-acetylmuramate dehydrogenase [Rhodococcus sp. SORGH_AS303]|nr:UDP-N-acetylmuramate dehydrogenase [Rhodococcus sp. SORGH_AS_0303]
MLTTRRGQRRVAFTPVTSSPLQSATAPETGDPGSVTAAHRPVSFADLTTIHVGGPVGRLVEATTSQELVDAVRSADAAGTPVLVIGGGSNLLVGDDGFDGTVVRVATSGLRVEGTRMHVDAGVEWDLVVRTALDHGLAGIEALSGIPGSTGGTPVQNVGAYGASTSDWLESVTVLDRESGEVEVWDNARCGFGSHRSSAFKYTDRYVVVDVTFALRRSDESAPVRYAALAERLGVRIGESVSAREVRDAVIALRTDRGMVWDEAEHDSWSVGSFFLNPIVSSVPPEALGSPQFTDPKGIKLSAAWLIEHAGFSRGYGERVGTGRATLSTRHVLAVTNRGGASAADVTALASHVRAGVQEKYGITLTPECRLVNCTLD